MDKVQVLSLFNKIGEFLMLQAKITYRKFLFVVAWPKIKPQPLSPNAQGPTKTKQDLRDKQSTKRPRKQRE